MTKPMRASYWPILNTDEPPRAYLSSHEYLSSEHRTQELKYAQSLIISCFSTGKGLAQNFAVPNKSLFKGSLHLFLWVKVKIRQFVF